MISCCCCYCYYYCQCGTFFVIANAFGWSLRFTKKNMILFLFSHIILIRRWLYETMLQILRLLYIFTLYVAFQIVRTHRAIFTFTCQRHTLLLTDLSVLQLKSTQKSAFIRCNRYIRSIRAKKRCNAPYKLGAVGLLMIVFKRFIVSMVFLCVVFNTIPFLIFE